MGKLKNMKGSQLYRDQQLSQTIYGKNNNIHQSEIPNYIWEN